VPLPVVVEQAVQGDHALRDLDRPPCPLVAASRRVRNPHGRQAVQLGESARVPQVIGSIMKIGGGRRS
jgi:hypothetical protein